MAEEDYFKSREYAAELKSLDLSSVTDEIEKYNQQYGMGAMLARAMTRALEAPKDEVGASLPQQEEESRQAFLQRVENTYGIVMAKSGIGLEPVRAGAVAFTEEGSVENSKLRVNLKDRNQFLLYLVSLEAGSITVPQARGLFKVAESLSDQLREEYSVEKNDARAIELMASLAEIIGHYKRLDPNGDKGLGESMNQLSIYFEQAQKGCIREYIMVERSRLLGEVGGKNFGPSKWHTDSTEQEYDRRWQEALVLLDRMQKNHNAGDLYVQLSSHLRECAKYAKKDLEASDPDTQNERVQNKLMTLAGVLRRLSRTVN